MADSVCSDDFKDEYHRYTWRKVVLIASLVVLIIVLSSVSCMVSGRHITFMEGLEAIWNHIIGVEFEYNSPEWWNDKLIWSYTMPRVSLALLAGAGLAVSGAIMQSVLSNPLAEPYTMGVSSGAVFGANVAIVLGLSVTSNVYSYGLVLNAFIFGLIPVAIIIVLMKVLKGASAVTMILSGVAISYFFSGLNTLILVSSDSDKLSEAYQWQVGSLDLTVWSEVQFVAMIVIPLIVVSILLGKRLNALMQGSNLAKTLGMDVEHFRIVCMLLVTVMAASILCFTGIIGFVGLLAPHIIRMLIGSDNRYVIPASCVFGAAFLLFADTITRMVSGVDVPVGAVMSFLGAPLFLYIILCKKNRGVIY